MLPRRAIRSLSASRNGSSRIAEARRRILSEVIEALAAAMDGPHAAPPKAVELLRDGVIAPAR
jgi:hypothetical protein